MAQVQVVVLNFIKYEELPVSGCQQMALFPPQAADISAAVSSKVFPAGLAGWLTQSIMILSAAFFMSAVVSVNE